VEGINASTVIIAGAPPIPLDFITRVERQYQRKIF